MAIRGKNDVVSNQTKTFNEKPIYILSRFKLLKQIEND